MKKSSLLFFICSIPLINVAAFSIGPVDIQTGIGIGVLTSGKFEASWNADFPSNVTMDQTTDPSWLAEGFIEVPLWDSFSIGLLFLSAPIVPREDIQYIDSGVLHRINRNDIRILDTALGGKYLIPITPRISLSAAIYGGFRWSFSSASEGREFGMALDGNLDGTYRINDHVFVYLELGAIGQPFGGVSGVAYVRGGPIVYIASGFKWK